MPSIFEYWTTMAYSTCNNYLKRYTDVAALKAGIRRHASTNGVQINLEENINDIARFRQGIPRQKRPIAKNILEAPPPKRARIAPFVVIEDLHAAVVDAPPAIVVVDAPPAIAVNNDSPVVIEEPQAAAAISPPAIVVVDAPYANAVNGAEIIEFVLKLSNGADFIVPVRCDGYVNVTKICQAAGKRLQNYKDRVDSKHFLDRYVALTGIQANAIFEVFQGGNLANVEQGTFAHPDIAIHIAQWCSADFSIQVSQWVRELRIKNTQLLTQIEELQAAAVNAPPAISINGARKPLVLNGITIEVDPQTLMVNATQMCSAAGKLFGHYRRLDSTEEFLQELSSNIHIRIFELVKCKPGHNGGTWVDWRVALHLAQWLSPAVQVQVTGWIDELRIENTQLLTQIEELQAAAVYAPVIAHNGAEIIEFSLKLSNGADFIVPVRRDGYVNVTKICQAAGKRLQHYKDRAENKNFLNRYVALTRIRANAIFEVIQGGNLANVEQGTFAHPDIAIHIAQWCSADFSIQVSQWVRQLMTTGRVELGNEMSPQQLDNAWQQRVQEEQARHQQATEALETRHRQATEALETRITTMERQGELEEEKTREELDAAIKTLARDTEQVPQFPDGANVLYAGYIGNWLIKYGQSSNFTRRLAEHRRHYPEFMLIKALPCDNAVASEKKLRDFVAKKRIGGNYNNEKEIICFETQEDVYKLIRAMQRSCRNKDSAVSVELKRIEADVTIQTKKIEADVTIQTKKMELLMQDKITFEQYLQMK
jgi:hypothetical protein